MKILTFLAAIFITSCSTPEQTTQAIDLAERVVLFSLASQNAPVPPPVPTK